eukprot:Clim_evm2s167 gene=Clim_evmTU2s167
MVVEMPMKAQDGTGAKGKHSKETTAPSGIDEELEKDMHVGVEDWEADDVEEYEEEDFTEILDPKKHGGPTGERSTAEQSDKAEDDDKYVEKDLSSRMALNPHKAGMTGVDQTKVNEIIMQVSKGSRFYKNELKKDAEVTKRVETIRKKYKQIKGTIMYKKAEEKANRMCQVLDIARELHRVFVHIDMDAFYAQCEELDRPELKTKPMAVGGTGMLTTANYVARKYGVRSAMPGYIAKKLCPELTIVPCDFKKYTAAAQKIREVIARYDPNYTAISLDEAHLELTEYLKQRDMGIDVDTVERVVQQIRREIFDASHLTCSAGIGPNRMVCKIATDLGKPNGQYLIPGERDKIMNFMKTLKIRKVPGIGRVTQKVLNAFHIETCGDLYDRRGDLVALFSEISSGFFIRVAMGIGATDIERRAIPKSIGHESTFGELNQTNELLNKCKKLTDMVVEEMQAKDLIGTTVNIKLKTVDFQIRTRALTLKAPTNSVDVIFAAAEKLIRNELPLRLRLMGVRMSQLHYKNDFERHSVKRLLQKPQKPRQNNPGSDQESVPLVEDGLNLSKIEEEQQRMQYEYWQQQRQQQQQTVTDAHSKRRKRDRDGPNVRSFFAATSAPTSQPLQPQAEANQETLNCPICANPVPGDNMTLNQHIDACLQSGQTEQTKGPAPPKSSLSSNKSGSGSNSTLLRFVRQDSYTKDGGKDILKN